MKNKLLLNYLHNGMANVIGFCRESDFIMADHLNNDFMSGGVLEIGVHHGQFFIGLNCLTEHNDQSTAVDVFDYQHLNIDNSGEGDLDAFNKNLLTYDKHMGKNVSIIKADSVMLNESDFSHKYKFISVDGGHTVEHVINDLKLASSLVCDTGIVVLDDWFNHWWPSVTEGLVKYLQTSPTLIPFATTENKMWLCKISHKHFYTDLANNAPFDKCPVKFYGHDIVDLY